jgi:hypothetical protein
LRDRAPVLGVLAVFGAAILYEILVALRVVGLGDVPGEGPPGSQAVGFAAGVAVAAAAVLALTLMPRGNEGTPLAALLAPAAAAFMVAHFYTYDAYSLPTLIRHSERDFVPTPVVFGLAALAAGLGLTTLLKRRLGLVLTVPAVLLCGLTAWFSGLGH